MATQNSTITVKGKLGNIVGYKGRDGKRLARIRQTEVKNPKTKGQIIQRMILATASKAYGRMKTIVDHSWQGVSYGGESQSYFLKKAMERIRKFVADSIAAMPASITDPLQWVGLARPDTLSEAGFGLQISEGTIPSVSATYAEVGEGDDKDTVFDHFGNIVTAEIATIPAVMNALGAKWGDQITIVGIKDNGEFKYSRYVLEANPSQEVIEEMDAWDGSIQSALFDPAKSLLSSVRLTVQGASGKRKIVPNIDGSQEMPLAAAVIISRKVDNVWQRSTQYLMPIGDVNYVDTIIKLWQLGTTEIATENPYYLNNADL